MSYAYLDDVYNTNLTSNLDNDYNKIVENILGINPSEKYNLTTKKEVSDFTNELDYDKLKEDNKKIVKKNKKIKEKVNKEKVNKENFSNVTFKECEDFLKHLEKCSRCRMILIKKFNLLQDPNEYKREQYLDIIIYALSGIFLLFLLDIVLNFGKKINKI